MEGTRLWCLLPLCLLFQKLFGFSLDFGRRLEGTRLWNGLVCGVFCLCTFGVNSSLESLDFGRSMEGTRLWSGLVCGIFCLCAFRVDSSLESSASLPAVFGQSMEGTRLWSRLPLCLLLGRLLGFPLDV